MEILTRNTSHNIKGPIVTIGNFDGFHIAHAHIIEFANKIAASKSSQSMLITFDPHPFKFFNSQVENYLITSFKKKMELLEKTGLDYVYLIEFDEEFSNMAADDFVKFLN